MSAHYPRKFFLNQAVILDLSIVRHRLGSIERLRRRRELRTVAQLHTPCTKHKGILRASLHLTLHTHSAHKLIVDTFQNASKRYILGTWFGRDYRYRWIAEVYPRYNRPHHFEEEVARKYVCPPLASIHLPPAIPARFLRILLPILNPSSDLASPEAYIRMTTFLVTFGHESNQPHDLSFPRSVLTLAPISCRYCLSMNLIPDTVL